MSKTDIKAPAPVTVSEEATRALSVHLRAWSGWRDSHLVFATPRVSPFAETDPTTHRFTANADTLVLNPNRVLNTVTPFRLRQEAVLTGALLHEAGHARFSNWKPSTVEGFKNWTHPDGSPVTSAEIALARLIEEPRVEGLMARNADTYGARGLDWTMRASAAHLVPVTELSVDPNRKVMDVIMSWALRAGRQIAFNHWTGHPLRHWVQDFTTLLHTVLINHLNEVGSDDAVTDSKRIIDILLDMIRWDGSGSGAQAFKSYPVDAAKDVLTLLFPETEGDEMPEAGGSCAMPMPGQPEAESGEDGEGDESGEGGEGDTEPEDEGDGTEEGAGDTGDEGSDTDEDAAGGGESDEQDTDEGEDQSDADGSGDGDSEDEPEDGAEDGASPSPEDEALAEELRQMEARAKSETKAEQTAEVSSTPPLTEVSDGAGAGGEGNMGGGWRSPNKEERDIAKGAERFLRDLIDPSEASKVVLTDTPSATVDGAALSAWKAGGAIKEPHFFRRTRRDVEPSPPVKIAILVDVSGSMEELQKPSAILSWALASACMDLRNFAGRGQQIESCLIHWGSVARVIQHNGQMIPGIREVPCLEGTNSMDDALDLVAEEMPGFFDMKDRPENRLIVQFTDWELSGFGRMEAAKRVEKALASGVNMVTVAPRDYSERRSDLPDILRMCKVQRGTSSVLRYNRMFPEQVWDNAASALSAASTGQRAAPFAGF